MHTKQLAFDLRINVVATNARFSGPGPRALTGILKVARTITGLAGRDEIAAPLIAEVIQYRMLDRRLAG